MQLIKSPQYLDLPGLCDISSAFRSLCWPFRSIRFLGRSRSTIAAALSTVDTDCVTHVGIREFNSLRPQAARIHRRPYPEITAGPGGQLWIGLNGQLMLASLQPRSKCSRLWCPERDRERYASCSRNSQILFCRKQQLTLQRFRDFSKHFAALSVQISERFCRNDISHMDFEEHRTGRTLLQVIHSTSHLSKSAFQKARQWGGFVVCCRGHLDFPCSPHSGLTGSGAPNSSLEMRLWGMDPAKIGLGGFPKPGPGSSLKNVRFTFQSP